MTLTDDDRERVRVLWRDLCGAPDGFWQAGVEVVDAVGIRSAPPGAVSIVVLGDAAVVAGPGVTAHRSGWTALGPEALLDRAAVEEVLGPLAMALGPAELWYGHTPVVPQHDVVGPVPTDHPLVRDLVADATEEEVDESSITDVPSGVYVALDAGGNPAAGCGWHVWPHDIAHVGVLAATSHRGTGAAASASAVALHAAAAAGLLVQWRAARSNRPSRTLAGRLGLTLVGAQFSVRPR